MSKSMKKNHKDNNRHFTTDSEMPAGIVTWLQHYGIDK